MPLGLEYGTWYEYYEIVILLLAKLKERSQELHTDTTVFRSHSLRHLKVPFLVKLSFDGINLYGFSFETNFFFNSIDIDNATGK